MDPINVNRENTRERAASAAGGRRRGWIMLGARSVRDERRRGDVFGAERVGKASKRRGFEGGATMPRSTPLVCLRYATHVRAGGNARAAEAGL